MENIKVIYSSKYNNPTDFISYKFILILSFINITYLVLNL
jgi:hypothetical protein